MQTHKYQPKQSYINGRFSCRVCGKQELVPEHSGFNWVWLQRVEIAHGDKRYEFVSKEAARKRGFQI